MATSRRTGSRSVPKNPRKPPAAARPLATPPVDSEALAAAGAAWRELGLEIALRGPHHLTLATRVARAATSGGGTLTAAQEDELARWFAGIVDAGIERTGEPFARATWYVLHTDWHRDPDRVRPPRCPAMARVPSPNDPRFVAALRAATPDYMRTVIAGASDEECQELIQMPALGERILDERYRPFAGPYTEDVYHAEMTERALAAISRRFYTPADMCEAVESWAAAHDESTVEATIPPVARIGAVAWLACVAIRTGGGQ